MTFHNRPCAARGLDSYRYKGPFGFVMIGAVSQADAMREAERSTPKPILENLERWNGSQYVPAFSAETSLLSRDIAMEFAENLEFILGPEKWRKMRKLNASPEYLNGDCCASHNFCDPNMIMLEAFELKTGREFLPPDSVPTDADLMIWNEAWRIAQRERLTAK